MFKSAPFAFALTLLLLAADAGARPGASFSHGFSSHAASSHGSTPHLSPAAPSRAPSRGFGSFSSRSAAAAPSAPAAARAPSGSFGAFGNAAAAPKQSDSALSQQLGKNAAQANALRTLDQRKAAQAAQAAPLDRNPAPQPAPSYAQSAPAQPAPGPTTVIVQQGGGGLGHVLAGAMIARSANAHAGYYPAPGYNGNNGSNGGAVQQSGGGSFFGVLLTLCCLALIAFGLWFAWRGWRKRRAALEAANKPNYSFERN